MQTKLTLRLEDTLINKAKQEAKRKGISLSKLVGEYFELFVQQPSVNNESITAKLSGVLKDADTKGYEKHLEEKYL